MCFYNVTRKRPDHNDRAFGFLQYGQGCLATFTVTGHAAGYFLGSLVC